MLDLVRKYIGYEIYDQEFELALPKAKDKLKRIVMNFGDDDKKRLTDEYLAQLIAEEINQLRYTIIYDRRSKERGIA